MKGSFGFVFGAGTLLCALLAAASAAAEDSRQVVGIDADLQAGAEALTQADYQRAIRLTHRGMHRVLGRRDRAAAFANLCGGYAGLGRLDEALAACERSIELHDGNWRAWHNLAVTQLRRGDLDAAREAAEHGLALEPDDEGLQMVRERIAEERLAGRSRIRFEEARTP